MSAAPMDVAREVLAAVPLIMRTIRTAMRNCRTSGLSIPQVRALGFVHRQPGSSLSDVAEHIGLTLPTMSRLIDGLVERGMLVRKSRSADRRCMTLALTPRGRRLLERAHSFTQAALAWRFVRLDGEKARTVARAMRIIQPLFADTGHGEDSIAGARSAQRRQKIVSRKRRTS